jgi:hypothetical protein
MGRVLFEDAQFPYPEYLDLECIVAIFSLNLDFCLGNSLKYLWRLGEKGIIFGVGKRQKIQEDLEKSLWYLDRYLIESTHRHYEIFPWVYSLQATIQNELRDIEKFRTTFKK